MQAPQGSIGGTVFGHAASVSLGASSSNDKHECTSIFSPPCPKIKRICKSEKTIEVSDSEEDESKD